MGGMRALKAPFGADGLERGGESHEGLHSGSASGFGCMALSVVGVALQALVVDARGVLALSVKAAQGLNLEVGHGANAVGSPPDFQIIPRRLAKRNRAN